MALRRCRWWRWWRSRGASGGRGVTATTAAASTTTTAERAGTVSHPDVAIAIDKDSVRREDQSRSKMRDDVARRIELENGVERRRRTIVRAATLGHPHA